MMGKGNFNLQHMILATFVGCLTVGSLYTIFWREKVGDERVYDCITRELRGAGFPGLVKTTEFKKFTVSEKNKLEEEERSKSQEEFIKIYKNKIWGGSASNPISVSGIGSTVHFTIEAISGLHSIITELKTRLGKERITMLDVPCGDMGWMSRFLDTREDVDYTGMDIVPELIEKHKKNYAQKSGTFIHRDVIKDGLMGAQYDLVFSREMLQHLRNSDVMEFLYEVSQSGSGYLLVTSFPSVSHNADLNLGLVGRFHYLNLEAPPMMLAAPLCYFRDGPNPNQKHGLMVYKLPLRQVVNCRETRAMKIRTSTTKLDTYYSCGNWSI